MKSTPAQLLSYEPLSDEGKLACIKLNIPTACPPRGAVPVNRAAGSSFLPGVPFEADGNANMILLSCQYHGFDHAHAFTAAVSP